jgi:hypothetical protein
VKRHPLRPSLIFLKNLHKTPNHMTCWLKELGNKNIGIFLLY